jgi:hypothetical protein
MGLISISLDRHDPLWIGVAMVATPAAPGLICAINVFATQISAPLSTKDVRWNPPDGFLLGEEAHPYSLLDA